MPVEKVVTSMEDDTHHIKVLALGIALWVTTALIVFSMLDAGANPDAGRALRVRDAPSIEVTSRLSGTERGTATTRVDGKRVVSQDQR